MIDLSICPLFKCNFNCLFCYIQDKSDPRILDLDKLHQVLNDYEIRNIDIYGGELTLINDSAYINRLISMLPKKPTCVFNGSNFVPGNIWHDLAVDGKIFPAFSIDNARKTNIGYSKALENIKKFDTMNVPYSIISIDIAMSNISKYFEALDGKALRNFVSWSIKPWSKPIGNNLNFKSDMKDAIDYAKNILNQAYPEKVNIYEKIEKLDPARDNIRHYFLCPDGELYDVVYENNEEKFINIKELDLKKYKISNDCLICKYYKHCHNEHLYGYKPPKSGECLGRRLVLHHLETLNSIDNLYHLETLNDLDNLC